MLGSRQINIFLFSIPLVSTILHLFSVKFEKSERTKKFSDVYANSEVRTLIVEKGDTLSSIAMRITGDASFWKSIWVMNKDKISNPNLISAGMSLKYVDPNQLDKKLKSAGLFENTSH